MASGWWMIMRQSPLSVKYHDLDLQTKDSVQCVLFPGYRAQYFRNYGIVAFSNQLWSLWDTLENRMTNDSTFPVEKNVKA